MNASRLNWRQMLPLVPPALLCLVAAEQVYMSKTRDLTPWKGGGFGMFSSNDDAFRELEVWLPGPEGEKQIELPPDPRIDQVAAYPTVERLRALGKRIGGKQRSEGKDLDRIRVAVWRTNFDPQTLKPRSVLLQEVVVELE